MKILRTYRTPPFFWLPKTEEFSYTLNIPPLTRTTIDGWRGMDNMVVPLLDWLKNIFVSHTQNCKNLTTQKQKELIERVYTTAFSQFVEAVKKCKCSYNIDWWYWCVNKRRRKCKWLLFTRNQKNGNYRYTKR